MKKFRDVVVLDQKEKLILAITIVLQMATFITAYAIARHHGLRLESLAGDSLHYTSLAGNLLCCHLFSYSPHAPFSPDSVRMPGYPVLLALGIAIGRSWTVILLIQAMALSVVPLILFRIFRRFNERRAFVAALVFACEPTRLLWSGLAMTDAPFMLGLLVSVLLFFRWLDRDEWKMLFASGAVLGFSTLLRPISVYAWIAFCIAILFKLGWAHRKKVFPSLLIFLFGFYLFVAPWMVRNRLLFGSWQLTALGSYSFAYANAVQFESFKTGKPVKELLDGFNAPLKDQATEVQVSLRNIPYYDAFAKRAIGGDWIGYSKFHLIKTIPFFFTDGLREIPELLGYASPARPNLSTMFLQGGLVRGLVAYVAGQPSSAALLVVGSGYWLFIWLGALLWLPVAWKDRQRRAAWVLLFLLIGYIVAASSGPVAQPRYRLPIEGFLIYLACVGWAEAIQRARTLTRERKMR